MKRYMRQPARAVVFGLLASLACAGPARADLLVLGTGGPAMNVHTFAGPVSIIAFPNGASVAAGSIAGSNLNGLPLPWVYCVDFDHTISLPGSYSTSVATDGSIHGNGVPQAGGVAWLLDHFASAATTADQQAGLQAAIWRTIYGSQFQLDGADNGGSNDANAIANYQGDLAALNSHSDPVSSLLWLSPRNGDCSDAQGQVTQNVVPQPSSLALLGIGTISVLAYCRQRRQVA